jgi:hypothetical protein
MLIRPAIGDTDPIRHRRPTPDGQFSGNILDEAMRVNFGRRSPGLGVNIASRRAQVPTQAACVANGAADEAPTESACLLQRDWFSDSANEKAQPAKADGRLY